ncbi:MAG: Rossmann-like fold-containing protein [Nanoarchaeota archaeon]
MLKIYEPAEDSYLLANVLKKQITQENILGTFLEIGCGSGIQIKNILELGAKKENIFCCDINSEAVKKCNELEVNCFVSNLFENVEGSNCEVSIGLHKKMPPFNASRKEHEENKGFPRFDVIIFNPPYLPEDKNEPENSKLATTGGKKGSELINKFLQDAKKYLKENGKIFLLTSSLTQGIDFKGYEIEILAKKKLFFEELFVWELRLLRN